MTIKLELSVEETNTILQALAKLPFETVNSLISKIHGAGTAQLQAEQAQTAAPVAEAARAHEDTLDGRETNG